ncbi:MAG: tail fiber domain-containing protein [Candidatus Udaeobacter sp.]
MNPLIQLKKAALAFLVPLVCFGILPKAQAVSPAPDGGYPGGNTAEGQAALLSLTTGGFNTAVGYLSLRSNTTNSFNTAVGAGALFLNTADENTATGTGALLSNTIGTLNTANGAFALQSNITGFQNTANGAQALYLNTIGSFNTANGISALFNNTTGGDNTANGGGALYLNTTGSFNTADGFEALHNNNGDSNTANGYHALYSNVGGGNNTGIGDGALFNNTTGNDNVALGMNAGVNATTGSNNVYIGAGMAGIAAESNACYIASIFSQTSANGIPVLINSDNKLGTATSSKRFKENIKPMDKTSEDILALQPVTFRYKKDFDSTRTAQFGLVAEDVAKVNPDLIVRDKEGKPYTVRYEAVNAMLLNEFLKEHKKTEKLEATVASLIATVKEQAAQIQRVSAQLGASRPAPQVVNNP